MKTVVGIAMVLGACGGSGQHQSAGGAGGAATSGGGLGSTVAGNAGGTGKAGNANGAGAAATSSGGSSGTSGNIAGGGAGPNGGEIDDPSPTTPDLTGLIPHSTKWMLVSMSSGLNAPDDIQLLDLETQTLTPANPDHSINVESSLSPDGRTFFFSNGDGLALSERIIHLEPNGFVPAHKLKDYENIAGAYLVLSWSFDSRFAMASRGASPTSVEVIDMWLEKRVHMETFNSIVAGFAPAGYGFFYDAVLTDGYEPRYGRVTQSGTSPIQKLPPDAENMVFSPSGKQLFYSLGAAPGNQKIFVLSLADGKTQELHAADGVEIARGYGMLPLADSVLVGVQANTPETIGMSFTRQVFLDPNKAPVRIADSDVRRHSDDHNLLIVQNSAEKTLNLIRIAPYVSKKLPLPYVQTQAVNDSWVGVVGDHAFYVATDGLHVDSLSAAGELKDTVVSTAGKAVSVCSNQYEPQPKKKLAFLQGDQEELVFVDLAQEPPVVVGTYQAPAGSKVSCLRWGDGDTALGFIVEAADKSRSAYVTSWSGAVPPAPKLALAKADRVYAVMYR
jgi:hypothetical protein